MDELMTFKEAVDFLKTSDKTLMKLLQEEDIPARKIGKEWRFSRDALIRWISEGNSRDYAKTIQDSSEED